MTVGICKLCLEEGDLQKSHYIPAALYPKNATLEYSTFNASGIVEEHMKALLLCRRCERRFSENGESEVFLHLAAKLKQRFPLHEKMRRARPREDHPDLKRFAGYELGLDMDKFAYFMLSVVWRGAVHAWRKFDGTLTTPLPLGDFAEPIRQYLLGKPFPPDTAVIAIVCSDPESRKCWYPPAPVVEEMCLTVRFHALGIYFRAMMGRHLSQYFRDRCCTSPRKCIFYGNVE